VRFEDGKTVIDAYRTWDTRLNFSMHGFLQIAVRNLSLEFEENQPRSFLGSNPPFQKKIDRYSGQSMASIMVD